MSPILFPNDKIMCQLHARVVKQFGEASLVSQPRPSRLYFADLCEAIIGQQLSGKAADTIIKRVKVELASKAFTPQSVLKADIERLRQAGCSYAKVTYIKNTAEAWQKNRAIYGKLATLDDATIIETLTQIKGIGTWTAEMFLMFTVVRPDVFSPGDLGLRNAMIKAYGLEPKPSKAQLIALASQWSPQRTLASRILWRSLELDK